MATPPESTTPPEGMSTCHLCHHHFDHHRLLGHIDVCKVLRAKTQGLFDTPQTLNKTEAEPYEESYSTDDDDASQMSATPPNYD